MQYSQIDHDSVHLHDAEGKQPEVGHLVDSFVQYQ